MLRIRGSGRVRRPAVRAPARFSTLQFVLVLVEFETLSPHPKTQSIKHTNTSTRNPEIQMAQHNISLSTLQNLVKRDPHAYKDDALRVIHHFASLLAILHASPAAMPPVEPGIVERFVATTRRRASGHDVKHLKLVGARLRSTC